MVVRKQESNARTGCLEEDLITSLSRQRERASPPAYLTLGDGPQDLDQFQPPCITISLPNLCQPRHRLLHDGLYDDLELPVLLAQYIDGSVELDIVPRFIA